MARAEEDGEDNRPAKRSRVSQSSGQPTLEDRESCETIAIVFRDQTGEVTYIKVKKTTRFGKVFPAYAQRKGLPLGALRFTFDGQYLGPHLTALDLEMEDGDEIGVWLSQSGD